MIFVIKMQFDGCNDYLLSFSVTCVDVLGLKPHTRQYMFLEMRSGPSGALPTSSVCQAPASLTAFGSNSKFGQNLECFGLKYTQSITVQFYISHNNYIVLTFTKFSCDGRICYKQERYQISLNFESDQNIVSATGARLVGIDFHALGKQIKMDDTGTLCLLMASTAICKSRPCK